MANKKRVHQNYADRLVSGSNIIKGFTLMVAITLIVIGCDSIVDQKTDADVSISTSDMAGALSLVQASTIECIDTDNAEYNEKAESKTIQWGNLKNPSSKTVDIEYYNTLNEFVLKLKSTYRIADVLVDDKSIKNFDGSLSPDTWQEFTFDFEQDWQAGDSWSFKLKVAGSGPPVLFDVEYTLIGECDGDWPRDINTVVVEVTSATGRIWMDRNLGANKAAMSSTDPEAYGDLYQWGRAADGHQIINRFDGDGKTTSGITFTLSNSDSPGHEDFIPGPDQPLDWRSPQNNKLWQGVGGINNPCPIGYRLPTESEWQDEIDSWDSQDAAGAFTSPLKLPGAGYRVYNSGNIAGSGATGLYWSSTAAGQAARYLQFYPFLDFDPEDDLDYALMNGAPRSYGKSVRCIKEVLND